MEVTVKKFLLVSTVLGASFLPLPGQAQMGMMHGGGMMNMSVLRHEYVARHGLDPRYASKVDPLSYTAENFKAGQKLYEQNCAACHGPTGLGNGPAGKNLNPPPPNIAASSKMPMSSDGYLYWTIAEGGVPLHTSMPPFKDTLKPDQIWKVIIFLSGL
jgi:mono/diheme cytochrome c family protein